MKANVKRIIPLLLVIVMCLIALPSMVYAASSDPTIDINAKGSITVTKYASTSSGIGNNATGMQGQVVPDVYTTLNDAKFVLFRIADKGKVEEYYNGTNGTSYTLDVGRFVYTNETTATYDGNAVTPIGTKTTSGSGTCTFSNLEVGIYVLKEITAPSQITAPLAEESLISIPMVNTKYTSGGGSNNNGNAAWMYDVYVYPKNHEATGTVELTKQDQSGNGLENVTFGLYKNELTKKGYLSKDASNNIIWNLVSETVNNGGTSSPLNLTTGSNGKMTLANLPANLYGTQYKLEEISAPDGYIVNKTPLYFTVNKNNTITWNETSGNINNCNNTNTGILSYSVDNSSTLHIELRNERPDLTKEVHENGNGDVWKNDEQYRLDDVITYRLKAYVPNNVDELRTYEIKDIPQVGITDNLSSVTVSYVDGNGNTQSLSNPNDFTVGDIPATATDGQGFKLKLTMPRKSVVKGKEITIQYTANMNANAVIAGEGNGNTATLTYSKDINGTSGGETYTITDEARVYTYQYQITKHKDSATGDPIKDVQFELLDDGKNKMSVVALTDPGEYRLALTRDTGTTQTLTTKDDGTILIKGLENGTYYLKETKTIDGYNLLSKPFEIEVGVYEETTWTSDTGYTSTGRSVKKYQSTNFYKDNTKSTPFSDNKAITNTDIINKQGFVLPQTGGMGYLLFCVAGIVLIGGGAMLIFGGRKKKIR